MKRGEIERKIMKMGRKEAGRVKGGERYKRKRKRKNEVAIE